MRMKHHKIAMVFSVIIGQFLSLFTTMAQTPTVQDCLGALPICSSTISVPNPYPYSGNGNYLGEILSLAGCYTTEANGIWYTFTVQSGGLLRFTLTPNNTNDDYDWILYNMTNGACATLSTTAASGLMASSNNWGAFGFNGAVGISTPNGGVGNCNGPGTTNGPKWNADLPVAAGSTYVLYISNWSNSTYGFTLDFSASTAVIFDNVPPAMDTIVSSIACASFDSLVVQFTENIKCDSVHVADFALTGPGGSHTITSVTAPVCALGGEYDNVYTIHFTPPVTQIGTYTLSIQPGAGFVEDLCGNLDTLDSIVFNYNGNVDVELTGTHPLCNGYCTGTIDAEPIGGTPPFTYAWNNGLPADSVQSNVCAGTYIVTITDDISCTALDTFIVTEPTALNLVISSSHGISCPGSTNCDGGAAVSVSGATPPYNYLWTSGETLTHADALCAGENWVTVTDVYNCIDSVSVDIEVPDSIETTGYGDTLICINNTAAIIAASVGGTAPYSYVWTVGSLNGPVASINVGAQVSPVTTTTYYVKSTDANGCVGDTSQVLVKVRPPLGLELPGRDTICPYDDITLNAQGLGGDSIYSYVWSPGAFGPAITVSPDESRWYAVTVSDYCGTPAYTDSVYVQVGGYGPIKANIRAEDDSLCPGEAIYLIASGKGGYNGPSEYRFAWDFTADTNRVQFVKPSKTISYVVTITDLCLSPSGTDTVTIHVGKTEFPEVTFTPTEACANSNVMVKIDRPLDGYRYDWSMGDGTQYGNVQDTLLQHNYNKPGCYDVDMELVSNFGCFGEMHFPCAVHILRQPVAGFTHEPANPTNMEPIVWFTNTSEGEAEKLWKVESWTYEDIETFSYEFRPGIYPYEVTLIVTSEDGCHDTLTRELNYRDETVVYIPGSFTPNGDGHNDEFLIEGEGISPNGFDLVIYDRWGTQLFRSVNRSHGWDGTFADGTKVPMGAYPFVLRYRDHYDDPKIIRGEVIVSKTGERSGLR